MESDGLNGRANLHRGVNAALWVLALAGLVYLVGLTVWLAAAGVLFPYQLDYGEGALLHFVREWAHGRPIYKAIEGYPYITCNYAPLSLLLTLSLSPLLGITYTAGRLWTLVAILVIAAIIIAWVRKETRKWRPAIVAATVFLGSPYIYHWAPLFRVDLLGLALTIAGLYAVWWAVPNRPAPDDPSSLRSEGADGKRTWLMLGLAALLFVAGLYAKQSFLFAPLAAVFYLYCCIDRRQAIALVGTIAGLGGAIFLLVNAITGGGFWEGLVASNVNRFLWPEFWQQIGSFFGTFAILTVLASWYVVDKFVLTPSRRGGATALRARVSPLDLYLLAALVSLGLAGKAGAWENYFFEALVALALCAGLGLARLSQHPSQFLRALAPLLVLAQVGLMWHSPGKAADYMQLTRESNQQVAQVLADTPDPIISEDMGLLVTNDKALVYYGFQYSQLARAGRWDQEWELDQLRDGKFSLVILEEGTRIDVDRYQRFTRDFLSALDRDYGLSSVAGKYELYRPDPLQHERRVDFADQVSLVGWSLDAAPDLDGGDTIGVTAVWQAQEGLSRDLTAFAHLVDEAGLGWAGDDHQPHDGLYPTSEWGPAEIVRDTFRLTIPPDAPPGLYSIEVGWYDPGTQERLSVDGRGGFRVVVLPVAWRQSGAQDLVPVVSRFGDVISLEGAAWRADDGAVRLTLRWTSEAYMNVDYTVFVHLVAPGQTRPVLAQGDAPPLGGRWPTSLWLPGIAIDDVHTVELPADLESGTYEILVGLYDPDSAKRLPLQDGSEAVRLTAVEVP